MVRAVYESEELLLNLVPLLSAFVFSVQQALLLLDGVQCAVLNNLFHSA